MNESYFYNPGKKGDYIVASDSCSATSENNDYSDNSRLVIENKTLKTENEILKIENEELKSEIRALQAMCNSNM